MWTKPEYSDMRFGFFVSGCMKLTTEAQRPQRIKIETPCDG
jgi:hypothetical protein